MGNLARLPTETPCCILEEIFTPENKYGKFKLTELNSYPTEFGSAANCDSCDLLFVKGYESGKSTVDCIPVKCFLLGGGVVGNFIPNKENKVGHRQHSIYDSYHAETLDSMSDQIIWYINRLENIQGDFIKLLVQSTNSSLKKY